MWSEFSCFDEPQSQERQTYTSPTLSFVFGGNYPIQNLFVPFPFLFFVDMAAEEYNAFFYTLVSTVSNLIEDVLLD